MALFQRATKTQSRLRLALIGPSGSGKTYTSLSIATALGGKIAVIDTERGSAAKYSDLFAFDTCELTTHHPNTYIAAIHAAEDAGCTTLIIDSLSHAWSGREGALELVDRAAKQDRSNNSFGAWRNVTPLHNALVDAMIGARLHIIATLRTKTEYIQDKDERGKTVIRKVGMQPIQRDGLEYEFDVVGDLTADNDLIIGKTRCSALSGKLFHHAGQDIATTLSNWLSDGVALHPVDQSASYSPVQQSAQAEPDPGIEHAKARIKSIAGTETFGDLKRWIGDNQIERPVTAEDWQGLANWVDAIQTERAKANGVPAL